MDDQQVAAVQLERALRAPVDVMFRCPLHLPVVVAVPPLLEDGTPFPTRYWLTCPLARIRVGRLESVGGVRAMERWVESDPAIEARFQAAGERYAAERDSLVPEDALHRPSGGVAGSERGVKCLHAHYADHRAGHDNPVGEMVTPWVEPLDCSAGCVTEDDRGDVVRNPMWREPK
ncbi:MAG: DUF501 domain-containing protein [Acidimicrobiia bacterium]|nr:DUF501 domain-containing protein [Acidimicrobiia bacterium]MDH3396358.1 DUF501 domain-containing protein [Acidimicrobiia bacterium]